jgi:hypothetical protein
VKRILIGLVTIACLTLSVQAQDSLNVTKVGTFSVGWGSIYYDYALDNLLLLNVDGDSLLVLNATDPTHPVQIGSCAIHGTPMTVSGNHVFIAAGNGLTIVDISTPSSPLVIGNVSFQQQPHAISFAHGIQLHGQNVYVAAEYGGSSDDTHGYLYIYDVSDLLHPVLSSQHDFFFLCGIAIVNDYIYNAECDMGLWVAPIQDPLNGTGCGLPDVSFDIIGADNQLYVTGEDSLYVLRAEDPVHPVLVGSYPYRSPGGGQLALSGGRIFVSEGGGYLGVIDVTNPENPFESGFYQTSRYPEHISIRDRYAFVVEYHENQDNILSIYDCAVAMNVPHESPVSPESFSLSAYPNPFNPTTTISFTLPKAGNVKLSVFDVTGREVTIALPCAATRYSAGEHHVAFDGSALTSGEYFVRMEAGGLTKTQKIMLVK